MSENYKYVINTCFNHVFELIYLNDNDVETFLNECKCAACVVCVINLGL